MFYCESNQKYGKCINALTQASKEKVGGFVKIKIAFYKLKVKISKNINFAWKVE